MNPTTLLLNEEDCLIFCDSKMNFLLYVIQDRRNKQKFVNVSIVLWFNIYYNGIGTYVENA